MIARHPERAGGGRPGAADRIGFLGNEHLQPLERGDQRSRHAGGASADDQQIDFAFGRHRQ
jgi:hypothetical protein